MRGGGMGRVELRMLRLSVAGEGGRGGGGGGRAHLLLALSRLTIDHTSLTRRNTVPARSKDAPRHLGAHDVFPHHVFHEKKKMLVCTPSCFASCAEGGGGVVLRVCC